MLNNLYTAMVGRKTLEEKLANVTAECNRNLKAVGVTITGELRNNEVAIKCHNPNGTVRSENKAVIAVRDRIPALSYGCYEALVTEDNHLSLVIDKMIGDLVFHAYDFEYVDKSDGMILTSDIGRYVAMKKKELKQNIASFCRYAKNHCIAIHDVKSVDEMSFLVNASNEMTGQEYFISFKYWPLRSSEARYESSVNGRGNYFETLSEAIYNVEELIVKSVFE